MTSAAPWQTVMPSTSTVSRALVLASAGLALVCSSAAWAHNGVGAAFQGHAGPYTVYAYDGYQLPHGGIEYRLVLLTTADGEPADNVTVQVTATKAQAARTTPLAHTYNNVVLYDLPNPYPGDWTIALRLTGREGRGHVSFAMHGYQPAAPNAVNQPVYTVAGGTPTGLIVGGSIAGAAVVAGTALLWKRR